MHQLSLSKNVLQEIKTRFTMLICLSNQKSRGIKISSRSKLNPHQVLNPNRNNPKYSIKTFKSNPLALFWLSYLEILTLSRAY